MKNDRHLLGSADPAGEKGAELLAPAGNFKIALAAFAAGADAVYCGLPEFSARAFADNFSLEDLKQLLRYAHANGRKVYVTFNTLIDEDDIGPAIEQLARLDEVRPDALIVQDLGVARLCRTYFPDLALHASTQLVAHNLEGVLALKDLGFSRVVLARELSLEEIASISKRCGIELECFIHGALCYSLSGLCLFGAMEKGRSGNRGKCPYCCRQAMDTSDSASNSTSYPFSMKDLRLGEDARKLVEAGVASLKIEGRMKSDLYVASVTKYYRQILDEGRGARAGERKVTVSDLETVFSRRTTELYFNHPLTTNHHPLTTNHQPLTTNPIDPDSLGHLGAEIGTVKRVTRDRDGLRWLRFHTARALERHDGLQFEAMVDGRHLGMGISDLRTSLSRHGVFEVAAGTDVEVLVSEDVAEELKPGMKIYCSASQAVRRMFPAPAYRPSDYAGDVAVDLEVTLAREAIRVRTGTIEAEIACALEPAKNPEKTAAAVEKAFSKLGETDYRLGRLTVNDPDRLFAPMSVLNDLRRDLVERLDEERDRRRRARAEAAENDAAESAATFALDASPSCSLLSGRGCPAHVSTAPASPSCSLLSGRGCSAHVSAAPSPPTRRLKIRPDQRIPNGDWAEIVVTITAETSEDVLQALTAGYPQRIRLSLPVYTGEADFNRLRVKVKGLVRRGFAKWEAADLATLRLLKAVGVTDVTADWTLYAFNRSALCQLADLGVTRFVASPENDRENLVFLSESGYPVEFLEQQSTPLFISLTQPAVPPTALACFRRDGLWVTTKPVPRTFETPAGVSTRVDLSWDPPDA